MPVKAVLTKNYVSAVPMLDQREIMRKVGDIQNSIGLTDVMGAFGRYKPSKMYEYSSWTNEALWKSGVVGAAAVTGSGTPTVVFALTEATSGGRRQNDIIVLPNGKNARVTLVATAANVDTITAVSVDGTNLTLASGNAVKFMTNVVGERSISRDNLIYLPTRYENLIQIFRESHSESDVQKLSYVEAPDGRWSYSNYGDKVVKLKGEVNAAMIAGQISNSKFSLAAPAQLDPQGGGQTQTTRGLKQYIDTWGINDTVGTAGTITLAGDVGDMLDLIVANKGGKSYHMVSASAPSRAFDNHLKNLNSSGVTSARMNLDGEEINYEVTRIDYGGFTIQKYCMPILDQPELFGGTDHAKGFYWLPEGKTRVQDAEGGEMYQPFVQLRYIPQPRNIANKGNEVWGEIHSGAYSMVNPSGDRAEANVSWLTHQGLEVVGAQHFGFQKVLA